MLINPITTSNLYQSQRKNVGFEAVNQKFLNEAQRQVKYRKSVTIDLLYRIQLAVASKKISNQEAIDTLKAIREFDSGNIRDSAVDRAIEWVNNYQKQFGKQG